MHIRYREARPRMLAATAVWGAVAPSAWYSAGRYTNGVLYSMYMTDRNRIDFEEMIVEVFGRRNCQPD